MTNIDELISAELARIERVTTAKGDFRSRMAASVEGLPQPQTPTIPPEALELPRIFLSVPASASTYRGIWDAMTSVSFERCRTEETHIESARQYVEEFLDVDLSRVRVEVVPVAEWNDENGAEGTTLKGGRDSHYILVPEICDCYPTELLVHEFAHTGHFTAQRANNEYPFFWARPLTAEFVAHVCQYNYLLEHRPRLDFYRALGQFVAATYALAIASAPPTATNFRAFIASEPARAFKDGWPMFALEDNYRMYCENPAYYAIQVERGIAQILALMLVDEKEGLQRFIRVDRIDRDPLSKLESAFPEAGVQRAYQQVDKQLANLLKRFKV